MAEEIHAQKTVDGWFYRIWSTVIDDYTSGEMNQGEVVDFLLARARNRALTKIPTRLSRARRRGTSSRLETRDANGQWDEPPGNWDGKVVRIRGSDA